MTSRSLGKRQISDLTEMGNMVENLPTQKRFLPNPVRILIALGLLHRDVFIKSLLISRKHNTARQ